MTEKKEKEQAYEIKSLINIVWDSDILPEPEA